MKIAYTIYPTTSLTQDEWMQEFKVSSQVPKYDGLDRAKEIMEQWQKEDTSSIFRKTIQKIKLPDWI